MSSAIAKETKEVVQKEEQEATVKAQKTQEIADSAQRDLDEALPALVHHMTLSKCANFSLIFYSLLCLK